MDDYRHEPIMYSIHHGKVKDSIAKSTGGLLTARKPIINSIYSGNFALTRDIAISTVSSGIL